MLDGVILAYIFTFIGLVSLYIEIFLPGGIMGVIGALLLGAGMWTYAVYDTRLLWDFGYLGLTIILSIVACKLGLFQIKRSGRKNSFYLSQDQEGYSSTYSEPELIDQTGESVTDLRPSGYVRISNKHYQALAQTGFISKGTPIRVLEHRGSHLIVGE